MAIIYGISEATKDFLKKMPKGVKSLDDIEKIHQKLTQEYDDLENKGLIAKFSRWNKKRQIKKIEDNADSKEHKGARGEVQALEKLSELPDDFHIFCGVNKGLKGYITYRRKRNLKSAQMDFVVVSKRVVAVIEVKNWSSHYYKNHYGIPPHEQVDRAGRVLWISIQSSWFSPKKPPVSSVLLSIQGNIGYNDDYGYVSVKNLNNINYFLQNKEIQFSEKEVNRLIGRIKGDITK
ncbi:Nuclease-related domain protein [Marine Group I thaumarchaeote SCGC AAA799-P11]|uniref:Nuclease-related domain protein n=1 Tax=Marine Group I thaumarchaeote SCGC AAA799-P11 TaxID=1502295 RepID=A0A087S375_9ARCH|nr:Nuclease-related domain protein [Marine Group I thaumarchaeote SCGC AAA799-P11]